MLNKMGKVVTLVLVLVFVGGCSIKSQNDVYVKKSEKDIKTISLKSNNKFTDIEAMILSLSNQLSNSYKLNKKNSIAITSLVDLSNLSKTSKLGRYISESLIGNLNIRGFNVVEYRALKKEIQLNKDGEYFISRDIKKLYGGTNVRYVLVGTYSNLDNNLLSFNLRVIDANNNKIVSSARAYYILENKNFINLKNHKLSF